MLPYSPRNHPEMVVTMPIDWKDVRKVDPKDFTLQGVLRWLKTRRTDPWKEFLAPQQRLPG